MPTWLITLLIQVIRPLIEPLLTSLANKLGTYLSAHIAVLAAEEAGADAAKQGTRLPSEQKLRYATAMVTSMTGETNEAAIRPYIDAALASTSGVGASKTT